MKRSLFIYFSFIAISFLAGIFITYPLLFHLGDMATGKGDEMLIAWIHLWNIHSFTSNIFSIFNGNIFYPFPSSLAFSDLFITSSILAFFPYMVIGEPISVVNVTLISSLVLLGFTLCIVSYLLTKDYFASLVSGLMVLFSPAVIDKFTHVQILAVFWVPLATFFFIRFLQGKKYSYLYAACLCFLFQMYNSFLPGYFIFFNCLTVLIFFLLYKKKTRLLIKKKKTMGVFFITAILCLPIIIPYYQVSHTYGFTRDIRETIHLALQPEDLLYAHGATKLSPFLTNFSDSHHYPQRAEYKTGYLGFAFSVLVVCSFFYFFLHFKKRDLVWKSFAISSLIGFILSFGPFLHLNRVTIHWPFPIPLPYALFYYILPGFKGFRNSSRWEMLFIINSSIVIALFLHTFLKRYNNTLRYMIYGSIIMIVVGEFGFPLHFTQVPRKNEFPKVYSWLNTIPKDSAIIEMPIYTWYMHPYATVELERNYYSTMHFRKTVNGASGYSPAPWEQMVEMIAEGFPSERTLRLLKEKKVEYIIIHKAEYDILYKNSFKIKDTSVPNGNTIITSLKEKHSVTFIKKFDNDYVFKIN